MELASTKSLSKSKSSDFDYDDSKFLFTNRKFVSIDRGLVLSTTDSSQPSCDSDSCGMDWDSFSEDDEIEVLKK